MSGLVAVAFSLMNSLHGAPVVLGVDGYTPISIPTISGGGTVATALVDSSSPFPKKQPSAGAADDVNFSVGLGLNKPLLGWLQASVAGSYTLHDGTLYTCDYNYSCVANRDFFSAQLLELNFPACDAASKDVAYLSMRARPQYAQQAKATPMTIAPTTAPGWPVANFRLQLSGLDTSRISNVSSLRVTIPFGAKTVSVGDIELRLPESYAQPFYDWLYDFVTKGNNSDAYERSGTLEYLDASFKTIRRVKLSNVGILSVTPDKVDASSDAIRRVTVKIYAERMTIE